MKTEKPFGVSERPRQKRKLTEEIRDKQARYRRKMYLEGKCPHCGKLCAPYSECQERRNSKRIAHVLGRLVKLGELIRVSRGVYRKSNYTG